MKSLKKGNSDKSEDGINFFKPRLLTSVFAATLVVTTTLTGYSQNNQNNDGNQQYGNQQQYNNQQSYGNRQSAPVQQSIAPMVAQYSEDVRNDILVAIQYPDILQKLAQIRENTSR